MKNYTEEMLASGKTRMFYVNPVVVPMLIFVFALGIGAFTVSHSLSNSPAVYACDEY